MTKPSVCSSEVAIQAFEQAGWIRNGQRGGHITLTKPGSLVVLTVPLHHEIGPGLLRNLIRKAAA